MKKSIEDNLIEKQRLKNREYQKENRKQHLSHWITEKEKVDSLSSEGVDHYLSQAIGEERQHETRVGAHTMKINPYEYALIKKAMERQGAKSSREFYIGLCRDILRDTSNNK